MLLKVSKYRGLHLYLYILFFWLTPGLKYYETSAPIRMCIVLFSPFGAAAAENNGRAAAFVELLLLREMPIPERKMLALGFATVWAGAAFGPVAATSAGRASVELVAIAGAGAGVVLVPRACACVCACVCALARRSSRFTQNLRSSGRRPQSPRRISCAASFRSSSSALGEK